MRAPSTTTNLSPHTMQPPSCKHLDTELGKMAGTEEKIWEEVSKQLEMSSGHLGRKFQDADLGMWIRRVRTHPLGSSLTAWVYPKEIREESLKSK